MGFAAFLGHLLLGIGPLTALYVVFVARKSFVVLLTLASAFYWLIVLLFISSLFRAFVPLRDRAGDHAAALISAVFIEQLANYFLYKIHRVSAATLSDVARKTGKTFSSTDTLYLSFGFGFGHAAVHSVFLFVSLLPLTTHDATIYKETCTDMSYFLVSALTTLGLGLLHSCSTVVFFDGLSEMNRLRSLTPPLLHLIAALLTVGNFAQEGCRAVVPIVLGIGCLSAVWAGVVCVEKGKQRLPSNQQPR